nr:YqzK family protein [Alteribacter populi]
MKYVRSLCETVCVFVLFMGCTLLFYYGILWVSDEYERYHRYDEPQGKAVKVIQPIHEERAVTTIVERLRHFYLHGE